MLQPLAEPGHPHRLLGQHVVCFSSGGRVAGALGCLDGPFRARHGLLVVAQVAVRVRELEEEPPGKSVITQLLHPRPLALQ